MNRIRIGYWLSPIIFLVSFMVACTERSQLRDMHDDTAEMKRTTNDMNSTTHEMRDTTRDMHQTTQEMNTTTREKMTTLVKLTEELQERTDTLFGITSDMADGLKQGDSAEHRRAALRSLQATDSIHGKISAAAKYFYGFEYQLWMGKYNDTEEKRLILASHAVQECLTDVAEIMDGSELSSSINTKGVAGSINALSVTMHKLNRLQEKVLKENQGLSPMSMYSLLAEALVAYPSIQSGKIGLGEVPEYVVEALKKRSYIELLFQSRFNFLAAMFFKSVVGDVALAKTMVGLAALKSGDANAASGLSQLAWSVNPEKMDVVVREETTKYLEGAIGTISVLQKAGIALKVDPAVSLLFKKLLVSPVSKSSASSESAQKLISTLQAFQALL